MAAEAGCRCVVVEERYFDVDYRSEYSAFWSQRFEDRPTHAKRLHFFDRELPPDELHSDQVVKNARYIGYSVLRPSALGPVGRTVLIPPPDLADAVLTVVTDTPSFFGVRCPVVGVPFCQQDGEYLVCAHTAAWISHYAAYGRGVIGRRLTAEIASIPSAEGSKHRLLPATGLTGEQLQAVFSAIGIPALFYDMKRLPRLPAKLGARRMARLEWPQKHEPRERALRVVCKYLNSGIPVVVLTEGAVGHVFTLVGWKQRERHIDLIVNDDQVGPYEVITDPLAKTAPHRGKWRSLMVPLPRKVFFTGEAAEIRARNMPELYAARLRKRHLKVPAHVQYLVDSLETLDGPVSLRSRLLEGREYKLLAERQGRSPGVLRLIRMAHLPPWVWVVEMHDRRARLRGEPCVLAEFVFDSTAHDDVPREHLASIGGTTTDGIELKAGQPIELYAATGPITAWWSMITDRKVDQRAYATPASTRDTEDG